MFLACDIGNSKIKAGFFEGDEIHKSFSFDNFENLSNSIKDEEIDSAAFSSVSPEKTKLFNQLLSKEFKIKPFQIIYNSEFNLKIKYSTPETLGIDRICSAEGAYHLFSTSEEFRFYSKSTFIISIDLGTATTINFIDYPGVFIGGMILPGMQMMFESLNKNTAQLPLASASDYKGLIGDSTKSSIASGVINSITGLLEKTISEVKSKFEVKDTFIYLTGGNAKTIIPNLNFDYKYIKDLVLVGVKAVYDKNFKF